MNVGLPCVSFVSAAFETSRRRVEGAQFQKQQQITSASAHGGFSSLDPHLGTGSYRTLDRSLFSFGRFRSKQICGDGLISILIMTNGNLRTCSPAAHTHTQSLPTAGQLELFDCELCNC